MTNALSRRLALYALLIPGIAATLLARPSLGQEAAVTGGERSTDIAAIQAISQSFAQAFEKGDAATISSFWTETGEYINENHPPVRGRAALTKMFGDFFAKRGPVSVTGTSDSIRFIGSNTAIEEGTVTVKADDRSIKSHYSSLYVQENGKWLIAVMKEWRVQTPQPKLSDLEWLIGTWDASGPEQTVRTTYKWSANKSFIEAEFAITPKGADKPASTGVQVIGYDPVDRRIRSWTFDSNGSYGHWYWFWDGKKWSIESEATLSNGMEAMSLNMLTPAADGSKFTWRSVERTMNGQMLPDVGPITVTRMSTN